MHTHFVRLAVSLLFAATFAFAQGDAAEAVRDLGNRWAELFNAGDMQGVANLYTEDAIVVNIDGHRDVGREAIYVGLATPLPEPLDQGTIEVITEEIEILGDTAYGMGMFVLSASDGSVMMQGTFIAIDKLVDGAWMLHRHVINMLLPEPEEDAS
jgi:uncharacterized protein (TIGR02246 family)